MRTSTFAPIAFALALSPLACADDDEPELLHEPGITYQSENGDYTYEIEATEWPAIQNTDRPFAIALSITPDPAPGDPGDVTVDFAPLKTWPGGIADKPPEVTPDPGGDKFLLNYTFKNAGYYEQEVTITDADGNEDICMLFYRIEEES